MSKLKCLPDYVWPSGYEEPIAVLAADIVNLATHHGLTLEEWVEDGFGPARGCWCLLPGGTVVSAIRYAQDGLGKVHIAADAVEVARVGTGAVLEEVLEAFGISNDAILWKAEDG